MQSTFAKSWCLRRFLGLVVAGAWGPLKHPAEKNWKRKVLGMLGA